MAKVGILIRLIAYFDKMRRFLLLDDVIFVRILHTCDIDNTSILNVPKELTKEK